MIQTGLGRLRPTRGAWKSLGLLLVACVVVSGFAQSAAHDEFTTIDVPGAGTGPNQGTFALNINSAGDISGFYIDASNVTHGFVRTVDGVITKFDVPSAGTAPNQGTRNNTINSKGAIAGSYIDGNGVQRGFVRSRKGNITVFSVPGASEASGHAAAQPTGLSSRGVIPGAYTDSINVKQLHAFVRARDGTITTFDFPGFNYTVTRAINDEGDAIAGDYRSFTVGQPASIPHGYVLACDGFTGFDVAGAVGGTIPNRINDAGEIAGYYNDANHAQHAFIRAADGTITTFDVAQAGAGNSQGTEPAGLNQNGSIVGDYVDANNVTHSFVRTPDGKLSTFDVPGAGTGPFQGTAANNINARGTSVGYYVDAHDVTHGFLFEPTGHLREALSDDSGHGRDDARKCHSDGN